MSSAGTGVRRVRDLSRTVFDERLRERLAVRLGPFDACLRVRCPGINAALHALYADYELISDAGVFSFHACLDAVPSWWPGRRKVRFSVDGRRPHEDMPAEHALAVLEWGINFVVAMRFHHCLMLHAAVVARNDGEVLLLPAAPGAGKTTLCAALALRGWRLFSDEFGLVRTGDTSFVPAPRPLALKNESIDVIRSFSRLAQVGPEIHGTRKGTVAHLKPPTDSVLRSSETGRAHWIVYPQWEQGAACELQPVSPGHSFMLLATNAFNYEVQGEAGFESVRRIVDSARSYRLVYSDLDEAIAVLEEATGPGYG